MLQNTNPFRPTRWEHHQVGDALIWFTKTAESLAQDKSFYVYGSRGSGKTSLLRSVCWEDLAFNPSLKMQRQVADFGHLGIYIRFPDHVSASMDIDEWGHEAANEKQRELDYHRFFSLAVELACIEKAYEATHALRMENLLSYQAGDELEIIDHLVKEFPRLAQLGGSEPKTFLDFARICRRIIRLMNEACSRGSVENLLPMLPVRDPNQLLSLAIEKLSSAVRIKSNAAEKRAVFKFCLDDCEVLSDTQKRSLNTLVRLSKAPVFWIVSSVDTVRFDSRTFIPAQPLTDADRVVISLNDRDEKSFKELCQAVVSLRLLSAASPGERDQFSRADPTKFFDLDARLGTENVNSVIGALLKRSTKQEAEKIQEAAEILQGLLNSSKKRKKKKSSGAELPYYEAYVLMHWRGREDAFEIDFSRTDIDRLKLHAQNFDEQRFSAWLRRKQSAALYHLASRLKVRHVPLAGANMVIGLADRSIRDFLEIMGEIFEEQLRRDGLKPGDIEGLNKFARSRTKIASGIQNRGILKASERYLAGVGFSDEVELDAIARMIRGLGHLVSILQTDTSDPRTLRTAERGIFHLKFSGSEMSDSEQRTVNAAIQQAELAGYVRPETIPVRLKARFDATDSTTVTFRLHRRFAPFFNFSYRGPYEVVRLKGESLATLIYAKDKITPYQWALECAQGWNSASEQTDLPFEATEDGPLT